MPQFKTCTRCTQSKPVSEYHRKRSGYRSVCKQCRKEERREYTSRPKISPSENKRCTKCGLIRPISEFTPHASARDGYNWWCKPCERKYSAKYRAANKDKRADTGRKWRERTRPERLKKKREYYAANKESHAEKSHLYYLENRGEIISRSREYYRENTVDISARSANYRRRNAAKIKANTAKRKAVIRSAEGRHAADDISNILKAQNETCVYCGCSIRTSYTVDHITPLIRGGSNWPENIQLLCLSCNSSKGAKTHEEYVKYLSGK